MVIENKNTTIQISRKTKEELDMLFADSMDYNEKIKQLIRICPDTALVTLSEIKKEMESTGKEYLEVVAGFLIKRSKDSKMIMKMMGGEALKITK